MLYLFIYLDTFLDRNSESNKWGVALITSGIDNTIHREQVMGYYNFKELSYGLRILDESKI